MAAGYREVITTAGVSSATFGWEGGPGEVAFTGTWGGATAKLQWTPDAGANWVDVKLPNGGAGISHTANGSSPFDMPPGQMRFTLSVVGAGASISAAVARRAQSRV